MEPSRWGSCLITEISDLLRFSLFDRSRALARAPAVWPTLIVLEMAARAQRGWRARLVKPRVEVVEDLPGEIGQQLARFLGTMLFRGTACSDGHGNSIAHSCRGHDRCHGPASSPSLEDDNRRNRRTHQLGIFFFCLTATNLLSKLSERLDPSRRLIAPTGGLPVVGVIDHIQ